MEDLSLHILDIAENSIAAGATLVRIRLGYRGEEDRLTLDIEDNGRGMTADFVKKALDPFVTSRTTRNVGLGLSLLAQSARETGGDITITSAQGEGTTVSALFRAGHIDMKPLGDIAETLLVLIAANPGIYFTFDYDYDKGTSPFSFDTREIRVELEEVPINSPAVLSALRKHLGTAFSGIRSKGYKL